VPTGIVVPGSVSSACTMPSCQHSTSIAALAVSTTAIT
jgi:ribosomal protein L18E